MTATAPANSAGAHHDGPPDEASTNRLAWRVSQNWAWLYWSSYLVWVAFFAFPLVTGLLERALFDRIADEATAFWIIVAVAGALFAGAVVREVMLHVGVIQWTRTWSMMESHLRSNLLSAQVHGDRRRAGRPVRDPAAALPRFRDDTADVATFVDATLDVSGALLFAVPAVVIMLTVSVPITLAALVPMVLSVVATRFIAGRIQAARRRDREEADRVAGTLGRLLGAATDIELADAHRGAADRLRRVADVRRRTAVREGVLVNGLTTFLTATVEVSIGVTLLVAVPAVRRGDFTLGELALFVTYVDTMSFLPRMAGALLARNRLASVAFDRMGELATGGRREATATPRPLRFDAVTPAPPAVDATAERRVTLVRLDVVGLTARHPDGRGVHHADLHIDAGELVVVTGPVGSGKTTLLRSLLGLMDADGEVRWNGVPIDDRGGFLVPPQAAYLAQVPSLFSDSLADNVLLGADAAQLHPALERAELAVDLAAMPDGTDTLIGPRGLRLSGGQRQRLATARALVRRPELTVIDDLSSAVDVETEVALWRRLRASSTAILAVSTRPVALATADRVIELRDGRIV